MSYFGSLILFYPGVPPAVTMADLMRLGSDLRESVGTESGHPCDMRVKFGQKIDQDYEPSNSVDWDDSGSIGRLKEIDWDERSSEVPWNDLSEQFRADTRTIYRSFLNLGSLTKDATVALTRWSEDDPRSGICPDRVSVLVDPISPKTLSDEDPVSMGMLAISFSGNGYFSWGPTWQEYAEQYMNAAPVVEAAHVARSRFPVMASETLDRISDHLGERFLNRDCYQPRDWILSVDES